VITSTTPPRTYPGPPVRTLSGFRTKTQCSDGSPTCYLSRVLRIPLFLGLSPACVYFQHTPIVRVADSCLRDMVRFKSLIPSRSRGPRLISDLASLWCRCEASAKIWRFGASALFSFPVRPFPCVGYVESSSLRYCGFGYFDFTRDHYLDQSPRLSCTSPRKSAERLWSADCAYPSFFGSPPLSYNRFPDRTLVMDLLFLRSCSAIDCRHQKHYRGSS